MRGRHAFFHFRLFGSRTFDDFADFLECTSPNGCTNIRGNATCRNTCAKIAAQNALKITSLAEENWPGGGRIYALQPSFLVYSMRTDIRIGLAQHWHSQPVVNSICSIYARTEVQALVLAPWLHFPSRLNRV